MVATQTFLEFSPLLGEDFQFDSYLSDGLKPPTSLDGSFVLGAGCFFYLLFYSPGNFHIEPKNIWVSKFGISCLRPTFQVQNVSFRQGVYIHTMFFSGLATVPWFGWCAMVRWILVLGRWVFRFFRSMDANGVGFFDMGFWKHPLLNWVNHLFTFVGHPSAGFAMNI